MRNRKVTASDLTTFAGIVDNFRALAEDIKIQGIEKYGRGGAVHGNTAQLLAHFVADYYSTPMTSRDVRNRLADIAQALGCCRIETILILRKDR